MKVEWLAIRGVEARLPLRYSTPFPLLLEGIFSLHSLGLLLARRNGLA